MKRSYLKWLMIFDEKNPRMNKNDVTIKLRPNITAVVLCFLYLASLSGCGDQKALEEAPSIPDGGGGGGDGGGGDGGGGGTPLPLPPIDQNKFAITIQNENKYPYYLYKQGAFATACEVANGLLSQDITCMMEMNEGDAYYYGVNFIINVPPQMCVYTMSLNYYYYNHELGYGPDSVYMYKKLNANGDVIQRICNIDGSVVNCNSSDNFEIFFDLKADSPKCVYDLSSAQRPNCCLGDYGFTTEVESDTGDVESSYSVLNWGGNVSECIGGAAAQSEWPKSINGFPRSVLYYTQLDGLKKSQVTLAPITVFSNGLNFNVANYYSTTGSPHSHTGYSIATTSNKPFPMDPVDDRSGTEIRPTQDSYEFQCLDEAFEIRNRIRIYLREWNTYAEFLKFGTTLGVTGNSDLEGNEGVDCNYVTGECNDVFDWDDFVTRKPFSVYNTTNRNLRWQNFPREIKSFK